MTLLVARLLTIGVPLSVLADTAGRSPDSINSFTAFLRLEVSHKELLAVLWGCAAGCPDEDAGSKVPDDMVSKG